MKKAISIIAFIILAFNGQSQDFPWPENFYGDLNHSQDSIVLFWSPPLDRAVSHYNVYLSGGGGCLYTKIKSTTDTSYTFRMPNFCITMVIALTAVYKNPDGESDKSIIVIKTSGYTNFPFSESFDVIDGRYCSWSSCVQEGADNWQLNQREFHSDPQSAVFISDSINSKANLYSPCFYSYENLVPTIEFMCKIPEIDEKSDSLIISIKGHPYTNVLHSINDWQLLSIPQLPYEEFIIVFKATSGGGGGVYIDDLEVKGSPVGMEKNDPFESSLLIYPNPATDFISLLIKGAQKEYANLKICTADGVLVKSGHILINEFQSLNLDISELKTGIYFIKVQTDKVSYNNKFMKIK